MKQHNIWMSIRVAMARKKYNIKVTGCQAPALSPQPASMLAQHTLPQSTAGIW